MQVKDSEDHSSVLSSAYVLLAEGCAADAYASRSLTLAMKALLKALDILPSNATAQEKLKRIQEQLSDQEVVRVYAELSDSADSRLAMLCVGRASGNVQVIKLQRYRRVVVPCAAVMWGTPSACHAQ